jgi:hypothetical protein
MSVITKGRIFANGEQLTAEKLNVLVDEASFNSSTAVDNSTTRVSASGAITVKPEGITSTELASGAVQASNLATSALAAAYPVGSIYMNATNATNPGTLLGFGTWVAFGAGRVPVGIDSGDTDFDTAEETGGVKEVTLTSSQSGVPAHAHKFQITGDSTPDSGTTGGIMVSGTGSTVNGVSGTPTDTAGQQIGGNTASDASSAHTNLQPYIVVHMWKRTA